MCGIHNYLCALQVSKANFGQLITLSPFKAYWSRDAPTGLTFNNCTFGPHCIYVFCIYLRTNSDLCHLHHKLTGFYDREEKCLLRGTNWVFEPKQSAVRTIKGCSIISQIGKVCSAKLSVYFKRVLPGICTTLGFIFANCKHNLSETSCSHNGHNTNYIFRNVTAYCLSESFISFLETY